MKNILKLEYLLLALAVVVIYLSQGFAWYWLILLFLGFDISALGYVVNKKVGAIFYNSIHSVIGPVILMAIYIISDGKTLLFIDLLWFFHITVDRTFGYGLKHLEGFGHTHLGKIGKAAK
ncbi:MAG: DUF4260 family protein [Segetibacter sp.]